MNQLKTEREAHAKLMAAKEEEAEELKQEIARLQSTLEQVVQGASKSGMELGDVEKTIVAMEMSLQTLNAKMVRVRDELSRSKVPDVKPSNYDSGTDEPDTRRYYPGDFDSDLSGTDEPDISTSTMEDESEDWEPARKKGRFMDWKSYISVSSNKRLFPTMDLKDFQEHVRKYSELDEDGKGLKCLGGHPPEAPCSKGWKLVASSEWKDKSAEMMTKHHEQHFILETGAEFECNICWEEIVDGRAMPSRDYYPLFRQHLQNAHMVDC